MQAVKSGLAQYSSNLRQVLVNSHSDAAAQVLRGRMFRASLVDNPLGEQVSLGDALASARERDHTK
ncbi:MAG: hypothetical protein ACR2OV_14845 [Hyphomicrobiaceae bacterium]